MDFWEEEIEKAWKRVGGRCECKRDGHGHDRPHNKELIWEKRNGRGKGRWHAHHRDEDKENIELSNCEILCGKCHGLTFIKSYEKKWKCERTPD
jgi:hypothetical protein